MSGRTPSVSRELLVSTGLAAVPPRSANSSRVLPREGHGEVAGPAGAPTVAGFARAAPVYVWLGLTATALGLSRP